MRYPASRITAAAHVVHNNYSEVDMFEAEVGELAWAEGTVRAAIERLGDSDELVDIRKRNTELRSLNLSYGKSLTRIWSKIVGPEQPEVSAIGSLTDMILSKLEERPGPRVEVTDSMVNEIALAAFGPSVVYDRDRLREALVHALQTR